jgi:thymidylate synthase (FAD)
MKLSIDRVVFNPTVTLIGKSVFDVDGFDQALADISADVASEVIGTPINNLSARVHSSEGGNCDDLSEFAGRQCYRSWSVGRSNLDYIRNVVDEGHGSIFEHSLLNFQVSGVSRTFSHELVRHRVGTAFSQESQRYVDAKDMRFVLPPLLANRIEKFNSAAEAENDVEFSLFRQSCQSSLDDYQAMQSVLNARLISEDTTPKEKTALKKRANEAARSLLHNAAETRMVFSCNLRELRHLLTLRGTDYADLEIKEFAIRCLAAARPCAPNYFEDFDVGPSQAMPDFDIISLSRKAA